MNTRRWELSEYRSWSQMKTRCYNRNHKHWSNYGGRGIKVCDRWKDSFDVFLKDIGSKPSPKHTIDRIDCDGNYEPKNCRWITRAEQNRNRLSYNITFRYECAAEASRRLGGGVNLIYKRLRLGWPIEKAFTTPVGVNK